MSFEIGKPVIHLSSVTSTNLYTAEMLRNKEVAEGTAILADFQTQGRGQQANKWYSDHGVNLLFTFILFPRFLDAGQQFYLSMAVSNAIVEFMSQYVKKVKIKWPNDILIDSKKTAGILIENKVAGYSLASTLVGAGINLNQTKFPESVPSPTSLKLESGLQFDLNVAFTEVCRYLNTHIHMVYAMNLMQVKTTYLSNLLWINEWKNFTVKTGTFEGCILDVTESGELIVLLRNGSLKNYSTKEITFHL